MNCPLRRIILIALLQPVIAVAAMHAASALYDEAEPLLIQRKFDEVLTTADKAIAADLANAEAYYYRGAAQINLKQVDESVTSFEKAVALEPARSLYHRALGDAYGLSAQKASVFSKMGWAKKCKAEYQKAVELEPESLSAHLSLLNYYMMAPSIAGGGQDKALAQADEIAKFNPTAGCSAKASIYITAKKYTEAYSLLQEGLKTAPNHSGLLVQMGNLAASSGKYLDEGETALKQCLETPRPERPTRPAYTYLMLGKVLEKKGDKAGAKAAYEEALKERPGMKEAEEALKKLN